MSALAEMPIGVLMRRRVLASRWADDAWSAVAVVPAGDVFVRAAPMPDGESYLVPVLRLALYADENDDYYENWIAPSPKVFVMWRMQEGRATPVLASVSYGEGTRMFDSGESADGVPMPPEVHAWLGAYLQAHYRPRPRGRRSHG